MRRFSLMIAVAVAVAVAIPSATAHPKGGRGRPQTARAHVESKFIGVHTHQAFFPGPDDGELGELEVWHYGALLVRADNGSGIEGASVQFVSKGGRVYCDSAPTKNDESRTQSGTVREPGHGYCGFAANELAQAQLEGGFAVVFRGGRIGDETYTPARCDVIFDPNEIGAVLLLGGDTSTTVERDCDG